MKIGVLTFCNAYNYGAALQAFSLIKNIQERGYDAELVDYRCPAIEAMHQKRSIIHTSGLKHSVYNYRYNKMYAPRRKAFEAFRKNMSLSCPYTPQTIKTANDSYDIFISGSDQVFNLALTKGDLNFFLDFADEDKKKVSFAASLGKYLPEEKETYKRLLNRFDALSVREAASADLLKKEVGVSCQVIPDPVFLHTKEEWQRLLDLQKYENKAPYILIYSLYESKELYQLADIVKKKLGLRTVLITKALKPLGKADEVVKDADPKRFLELLMNASYVVTNSFHGTAFSLIFEKQISVMKPSGAPERILDMFHDVGVQQKLIETVQDYEPSCVDYTLVSQGVKALRETGTRYLEHILS